MTNIFIGGLFTEDMESDITSNSIGVVHYAANIHQENLIDSITHKGGLLSVISALTIGSFPRSYKKVNISRNVSIYKNMTVINVKFNNIWGFRNFSRTRNLVNELKKQVSPDTKLIYVYSAHTPYLKAVAKLKKKFNFKICLIVPDLPQYMNLKRKVSLFYKIFKKIDILNFTKLLETVDTFVLLTEQMREPLKIAERPYTVIEGIYKNNDNVGVISTEDYGKYILYTGTLNEKFGIRVLINSFMLLRDATIKLVICGSGDSEDYIKEKVLHDSRIIYLGQVKNYEIIGLQRNAKILINPRQNTDEFTKYSFPSKLIEYGASGRPILCYKLDGIPPEYDKYLVYVNGNSEDDLRYSIDSLLSKDDEVLRKKGNEFKKFLANEKCIDSVSKKLTDLNDFPKKVL